MFCLMHADTFFGIHAMCLRILTALATTVRGCTALGGIRCVLIDQSIVILGLSPLLTWMTKIFTLRLWFKKLFSKKTLGVWMKVFPDWVEDLLPLVEDPRLAKSFISQEDVPSAGLSLSGK